MTRRFLAFDLETAKDIPGDDFNWRPHRPLGITCAATLTSDGGELRHWSTAATQAKHAPRMSRADVLGLVRFLEARSAEGYAILTWNGLGFDFDILAEESGAIPRCRALALSHVDMMFHIFCVKGFRVGLSKAAEGMSVPGKPAGMSGLQAPQMWAQGRYEEVLAYVAHDVRIALQIAQAAETRRKFTWITGKGSPGVMALPNGWLPVPDALRLPEPDTSWMRNPPKRREFLNWTMD